MKRLTNIMQKQLSLIITMLLYVATYGQSNYLPRFLYDDYSINPANNAEAWLANTVQMAIEESLASNNHRFIAMRANSASAGGQLRFDDRMVRFYDGGSIYDRGITLSSELFKCYDSNIPTVHLCRYYNGIVYATYNTFASLSVGYNNVLNMTKDFTILVLPMLKSVSSNFYTSYYQTETVSAVTEGDEVWFGCTAEGDSVEAFACTKGGSEMVPLGATKFTGGGSSCSFYAKLISSLSNKEEQDIYIFSYVTGPSGEKYYSSNYKKLQLTVNPAIQFVNALEKEDTLYVTPEYSGNLLIYNKTNKNIQISPKKTNSESEFWSNTVPPGTTTSIKWDKKVTKTINIQVNGRDHDKTYTVKELNKWGEVTGNCSFKLTKPDLPSGIEAYPYVSYDVDGLGLGHGSGGRQNFNTTYSNRYKYSFFIRYSYNGNYIDCKTYPRDLLPMKLTPDVKYIKGCENGEDASAGTITVKASGGSGTYTYSSDGINFVKTNVFSYKTTGLKTVYVEDEYGCKVNDTTTMKLENKPSITPKLINNIKGCQDGNDNSVGKISVTATSGSGNYTYSSDGINFVNTNVFSYKTIGPKNVYVKDSKYGCVISDSIEMKLENELGLELKPTNGNVCADENGIVGTITASGTKGSGQYTYSIDGTNYDSNNEFSYKTQGTKTVYVKDSQYGCVKSGNENIKINNELIITPKLVNNIKGCENGNDGTEGKITVTASGGSGNYTFSSDGVNYGQTKEFTYKTQGAKTFYVKDVTNSCIKSKKINLSITQVLTPSLKISNKAVCAGEDGIVGTITVNAKNGSGNYTYSSDGVNYDSNNEFSYKTQGPKTVYVKDTTYGCVKGVRGNVKITNELVATPRLTKSIRGCENGSDESAGIVTVTASGGSRRYTYSSDGETFSNKYTFSYKTEGLKTVYVRDNLYNCVNEATIDMPLENELIPKPQLIKNIQGCENGNSESSGIITVAASGGSRSYTYSSDGETFSNTNSFSYVTEGFKTVYVSDTRYGCVKSDSIRMGLSNELMLKPEVSIRKGCADENGIVGTITVKASGGSGSYTYSSDGKNYGETSAFNYKDEGYKTVYLQDGYGCVEDSTINIEIENEFSASIVPPQKTNGYDIACNGGTYTLTLNISGGTPDDNGKYYLNNNPINPEYETAKNAGSHSFIISDIKGCSVTQDITLTQPDPITVDITSQVDADCKGEDNGSVTVSASGGAGGYTYYLQDENYNKEKSENGKFINKLSPGNYSLTVIDKNECIFPKAGGTKIIEIGNNNLLTLHNPKVVDVECFGKNTGSITLEPEFKKEGFGGGFNYWLNGEKKESNIITGLYADEYKVKVQPDDSKCFVELDNIKVGGPEEQLKIEVIENLPCTGHDSIDGKLKVEPTGGTSPYTIRVNDEIMNGNDMVGLPSGEYTISLTDKYNCPAEAKTIVIDKPAEKLELTVSHEDVKCNGESTGEITASASGGWGDYTFTLNDKNGKIEENKTGNFTNLPAGDYTVIVLDKVVQKDKKVTQTATVEIKQYDPLSASYAVDSVKCNGGNDGEITVTVLGGKGGYTLSLDDKTYTDNDGIIKVDGLTANTYEYTIVDANGCTTSPLTSDVGEPTAIELKADAAGELKNGFNIPCADGTGGIVVSAKGGTAGYQFSIDGGPFTVPYGKDAKHTFSGLEAGEHKIMVKDGHECLVPVPAEVKLTKPEPIIITKIDLTQPLCNGDSDGEMTIYAKGGVPDQNDAYNFSLDGNSASEKAQHTFTGLAAKDNYHVVVTDANECFVEKDIDLGQPAKLEASVSNVKNNLCNGDELGIITFAVNGGIAPYGYSLNGKDKVAFSNDMTISGLPSLPNKTPHSIVVSDAHGCKADAIEQEITEPDKIAAKTILNDYNGYNISCFGDADTARIEISGGVGNYRTTLDDRTLAGNDVKFDGLTEGSYSYKVIDGNNCSETFDFVMTEPANLSFVFVDSTDVKCYNKNNGKLLAVIKGGVANYVYDVTSASGASINKKTTNSTEYSYNSIAAGKYMLNVTDANNCVISQSYTIGQPDPLTVSVNKLKDVDCKGAETGAVSATAKGGIGAYSYSWNKGMTGHIAQNLPAGEYSVLVTDANNCQSEVDENGVKAQTTIDEPAAALTMLDPLYTNPTCSYNEDGIITINVSGGWGGYEYTLNGVSYGSNKIEGLDEGTYTAKVKDAGGCEVPTNDITLKKPEALSFENKIGTIICNGGTTEVTITSASGGTEGNYSYSIDGEKTWQSGTTFTGVTKGNYTLKMKDGNECTTEHAVNVTEPDKLVLKEDVWHNYNGTTRKANGKITVTPQGGVMPYSYQWKDTTVTSQVLDNIGFGLYTVIVTDKLGCVETNTYYINDNNPTPEVVDAICPEGADGSIRFGETVECTRVEWYNARTEEQLMQSDTKTITGLPKGIYKAKLFNDSQVTYIYAEVKAPDSLEYVQNQTDIDCHGDDSGKASVSITGGVAPVSVIWKNQKGEEISRNQTIENLITGKYTAYISDAQNCQSSSKTLVFDITEPADAFVLDENTHNNVKCYGNNDGVVVLRTSGNQGDVTYFQNGAAIPSNEAKSLYAGDYAFYAVDAKNCKTQTMNVVVSQPEPLSSSVKTIMPIKCAAETGSVEVEAEGGTTPYSYKVLEHNDFRLSPIFDGLTTADYKFVVKDVNNCYDTASYLLTEPEQLVITGNQLKDEYCGHSDGSISIEIAGGTGGYDTRWSDYQTGESASDLAAGSYQVSVFDENGCLATETYEIKNIPAPVVSIRNIDSTKCYGSADGVAELNVSLGTGAISYLWATDTTDVPYSGKLKAGLQSVVAVDELGCADTTQFTMPQPDSMKIVIAVQNPLCFNDNSGKLTASVSNFKSGLSYIWDNGVDGNENADLYAGTYGVSVTNANGCIAKKNATLVYPAKITIKKVAIADTKCDQPNGSISVSATGGTGILKYGVNLENMAAANKIEGLQSGNHKLTVIDENQCSIDTTIFVGAKVPPELVINTIDDVRCQGEANGKVSVGVNGGMEPFAYSWNNGNRTTSSTQNGFKVGNHNVLVFDAYGCSDTLSFAINEPDNLVIYEGTIVDPTCFGYSDGQIKADVLGGIRPYSYQWSNNQSVAQATGLPAGSHYLNVTDKNGCKAKKYFSLTNPQPVVVDIPDVIDICSNQTADIDAGYEGSFHYWSSANGFESVAQNISVNKKGTYVVTVTTLDGCIGTDSTFVNVSDKEINSNFLLQSDAYVGDTIVMIEISWPLPESIEWSCPEGMTIISDAGDEIEIVADQEGVYDIGLTTYNDICTEQTFKSIVVNPRAQKPKQMLQAAPKIIKSVNVYPSPTTGPFNLEIELNEEHDVSIEVVHISGKLQTVRHMKGDRNYVLNFSNAELNAGIHTISVSAGVEKVTKKVVIVK